MGFDAVFKRYFAAVVCLLIALAAYFQASGIGQLVAAAIALDPSALPRGRRGPKKAAPHPGDEHSMSAAAILARNPFDSVTGPLDGKPIDVGSAANAPVDNAKDPYRDPVCDFARVILIAASDDPDWSFAAIAGPDGKSQLRRQGDEVAGHAVFYIGDLRTEDRRLEDRLSPYSPIWDQVWFTSSGGARCRMEVGGKAPAKGGPAAPAASANPAAGPRGKGKGVPTEISSKIHKINDHEFDIERSVVASIMENQAELMRSARIVPDKEGDKVVGVKLYGIRGDSLLGMLGLENADRLSSINGFEMSDPQKALEAYARLSTADHLTLSVNRQGKPMNIDFNIK